MSLSQARVKTGPSISFVDVFLLAGLVLFVYAIVGVAHEWAGPYRPKTEIDLHLAALLRYSFFSLVRVSLAYSISLCFTLVYGYVAAKSPLGEPVLIPLLDILQSVPVLGFMPGLVLALVSLFPRTNLGLELAAILLICAGAGWNMVFSFYASLKSVPEELRELTRLFRLPRREVLRTVELPYAMNGLVWNSMLSMAGGWFFLMVIESFTLGDKDFRLPGLGSYMAVAYEQHDVRACLSGITAMILLIILVDRCVWAPMVVWSSRFKWDRGADEVPERSLVLEWLKRSNLLAVYYRWLDSAQNWLRMRVEKVALSRAGREVSRELSPVLKAARWLGITLFLVAFVWGLRSMYFLLSLTSASTWMGDVRDTFYSFLRVAGATILGSLWAIPVGVFIGTHPVWTRRLQPVVQIVASFPAPMLFPFLIFVLLKIGVGFQIGAMVLMLFASQWYILFNVIAGARLIPDQYRDVARIFRLSSWGYWKAIVLPAIFPSLVNGWITAAGAAWNATIVAECLSIGDQTLMANGIGANITLAAQAADFPQLASGVLVMVTTVVLLNRFFWGGLYRLAETRFRMD